MLANRPKGISINKNAINVQANNLQSLVAPDQELPLKGHVVQGLPLKSQQANKELLLPLKGLTSKTPSPPKLKSIAQQSENDVPMLIDLQETVDDLYVPNKQAPRLAQLEPVNIKQLQPSKQQQQPQQTIQSLISRIPRLRDVEEEVEDIDKSNIDSRDAIFQVCDVAKDIYSYMYELEEAQSVREDFLKDQKIFTPKVRQRLVNWCVDLTHKLGLIPETMYMTISVIDRYFDTVIVKQQRDVQLVALGALFVASKYEEIYPPDISDLVTYSEHNYSRDEIIKMERGILRQLDFNLGRPIPPAFLRRYSRAAHCDLKMHSIAKFLMEISLSEYECSHWKPSLLAATALFITVHLVHNQNNNNSHQQQADGTRLSKLTTRSSISNFGLARRLISGPPTVQDRWSKTLVHYTRYTRTDLQGPAAVLCKILKKVLKTPQAHTAVKSQLSNLPKWPELKSTRVDDLIRS